MTWQLRKTKTIGPLHGSLSKRGIGVSAGAGPVRYSVGADGKTRQTVRVPGTGIYATKVIGTGWHAAPEQEPQPRAGFNWAKWVSALTCGLIVLLLLI